jgi:quercetin dioxygenase-like cupin family protein
VMTRRELNGMLAAMATAFFSEGSGTLLRAQAPPQKAAQDHDMSSIAVETLMQEPLAATPDAQVRVITLTVAPGSTSGPHQHTGPVFAYLLEGEIENQVDPNPPRKYKPGEFFYEPPLHVHRLLRNLSATKPAKLLIFEVEEKGKQFTLPAK